MTNSPPLIPSQPLELNEGKCLGGYLLQRRIGSGAMADVWLAIQRSLNRTVALKILRPGGPEGNVERLTREARTVAWLDHPNIVRIYEVGEFPFPKTLCRGIDRILPSRHSPLHFIAEEYIQGLNLRQWLDTRGKLDLAPALAITIQTARALHAAAQAGIVHRDIKPENILLARTGEVKIVDFGLAVFETTQTGQLTLTQIGITLGTPLYMSPEQAESQPLDVRSDIYSLGITLYQILSGKVPFTGPSPISVLLAHRVTPPTPIRQYRPDLPEEIEELIQTMLAKLPEDRFSSAEELIKSIEGIGKQLGIEWSMESLKESLNGTGEVGKAFEQRLLSIETSSCLQTQIRTLNHHQLKERSLPKWKLFLRLFAGTLLLFLFGGLGYYGTIKTFSSSDHPEKIEQFNTVEEQWVFAAQVGTSDAWLSLIEYYPEETYWCSHAEKQLARAYMLEGNDEKAQIIFQKLINNQDPTLAIFGKAGLAWIFASQGDTQKAAAILSDIRNDQTVSYDRLTEDILSQTARILRSAGRSG